MADEKTEVASDETVELTAQTMLGDLMGIVINQVKALPKSWQELGEADQDTYLESVQYQVEDAIRKAVGLIASDGFVSVDAVVESVTFKDGVKAVLKSSKFNPAVHDLADAEGKAVKVVICDVEQFTQDKSTMPEADKDQTELALEDAA